MLCPMMTGDSYNRGERIDTSKFGADPGLPTEEAFSDVGEGETSFGWHKRKGGNPFNKCDEIECSSIFVEPLRWMTTGTKHQPTPFYFV
ncbi:hypothetical protein ACSBR1_034988 [Camellia fascicularis]